MSTRWNGFVDAIADEGVALSSEQRAFAQLTTQERPAGRRMARQIGQIKHQRRQCPCATDGHSDKWSCDRELANR